MNEGLQDIVRDEIAAAMVDKDAEIERLQHELAAKVEEIEELQKQLLKWSQSEDFLNVRNEDYFDSACQQLCQHVQQWVLRFSKFSDNKLCRLSTDINDEKLRDRLDDAILDGSLKDTNTTRDPLFGFEVPTACTGVPSKILQPRAVWADSAAYDKSARKLAGMFQKNFQKFEEGSSRETIDAGPAL